MNNIYKKVAEEQNLPIEVIEEIYKSFYSFMRDTIKNLNLEGDLKDIKSSFNIPSIGKLYLNQKKLEKIKKNL